MNTTKYRKKPVVVEAAQWFKNGDHPEDKVGERVPDPFEKSWGATKGETMAKNGVPGRTCTPTEYILSLYVKDREQKECDHNRGYIREDDYPETYRCIDCTKVVNPEEVDYALEGHDE